MCIVYLMVSYLKMHLRQRRRFFCLIMLLILSLNAYSEISSSAESRISPTLSKMLSVSEVNRQIPVIVLLDGDEEDLIKEVSDKKLGVIKGRFNLVRGFYGRLSKKGIEELAAKTSVKKIFYDEVIPLPPLMNSTKHLMSVNNDAVGASTVWGLGYTGKNITIAVIDTGVDYTHPDLGGCLGVNCKVRGGYDFVNNDADPMDDVGHGTHCAGIAAANGSVKGVAPDARILAAKVCDEDGCLNSLTMRGIDWAVGNGADVISLSLGSAEKPSDGYAAVEVIVDAAVSRGVVVVASSGNEGSGSGTLGDIASSRKVIAVGADDIRGTVSPRDDLVASFSSRGPADFGRFKPELVAPGVSVYSTYLGGRYSTLSGTSMACPHVAGVAALLLEYNNSLSPTEVKSLLIHSATNISGHPFEAGAGLVNASRAINSKVLAWINNEAVWEATVATGMNATAVLRVKNRGNASVNLSVSSTRFSDIEYASYLPPSSLSLPQNIFLGGGEEKSILINFSCPMNASPETYASIISLIGGGENIRIPATLTVPLFGSSNVSGIVDDECDANSPEVCGLSFSGGGSWGDWKIYKIINPNGTSFTVDLNWSDVESDLDMYLFSCGGELINYSGAGNTTSEHIEVSNQVYSEYWVAVYGYGIGGSYERFNLSVKYSGTLSLSPDRLYDVISKNSSKTLNFSIINDASNDSGLTVEVVGRKNGASKKITGTISNTGSMYLIVWKKSTGGLNLENATHLNASLSWSNYLNDLDLFFVCKRGVSWVTSRYSSNSFNNLSGEASEFLDSVDISYYLSVCSDVGVGISNAGGGQSYTLILNFSEESGVDYASVTPKSISSLPAYSNTSISVTLNSSLLEGGRDYGVFVRVKKGLFEVARAPVVFTVVDAGTTTTITTTTSTTVITTTTTTTTVGDVCSLAGDLPPCGEVSLSEVILGIDSWASGVLSLSDVISLINAWANNN